MIACAKKKNSSLKISIRAKTFLVKKIIEVTDWMKNDEQMHLEKH
jgi:hypothetical protein